MLLLLPFRSSRLSSLYNSPTKCGPPQAFGGNILSAFVQSDLADSPLCSQLCYLQGRLCLVSSTAAW